MKHTSVYIEKSARNESIFVLHMNRGKKLNALNNTLVNELHECIDHIQNDPHARALIIRSESENAFCAGIDTSYVKTLSNEEVAQFMVSIASLLEKISALPIVTIAAVRGYAYGAGADIALACDLRIGGESATFRFPGPQFGVVLGTKRLIHEVGSSRAREIIFMNKTIQAREGKEIALLHEVVADHKCIHVAERAALTSLGISKQSLPTFINLFNGENMYWSAEELVRESVIVGNFQERFTNYVNKMKKDT